MEQENETFGVGWTPSEIGIIVMVRGGDGLYSPALISSNQAQAVLAAIAVGRNVFLGHAVVKVEIEKFSDMDPAAFLQAIGAGKDLDALGSVRVNPKSNLAQAMEQAAMADSDHDSELGHNFSLS